MPKIEARKLPCTVFSDDVFWPIKDELKSRNIPIDQAAVNTYLYMSAIIRAVLDYRSYITPSVIA